MFCQTKELSPGGHPWPGPGECVPLSHDSIASPWLPACCFLFFEAEFYKMFIFFLVKILKNCIL